jgi:hypothetical protein
MLVGDTEIDSRRQETRYGKSMATDRYTISPIETDPYSEAAQRILRPEDCALAVIDIQEKLLPQICASAKKTTHA